MASDLVVFLVLGTIHLRACEASQMLCRMLNRILALLHAADVQLLLSCRCVLSKTEKF